MKRVEEILKLPSNTPSLLDGIYVSEFFPLILKEVFAMQTLYIEKNSPF